MISRVLGLSLVSCVVFVAAANVKYDINYARVKNADELDTGVLERAKFGYTLELVGSGELIRIDSKVSGIFVEDCVSVETNDNETRIRRVVNSKCSAEPQDIDSSTQNQVKREDINEIKIKKSDALIKGKSKKCKDALNDLRNSPIGPKRADARRRVSEEC